MRWKRDSAAWEDEFRTFVAHSRSSLLRAATLLSAGNSHRAEDLVQIVMLRMYLNWRRIRAGTREQYARKILTNAHIDDRRRSHTRHEETYAEPPDIAVVQPAPADPDAAVFRALAELPPRMRATVILRHVLDVSVADTADALGCSEGNVKSQTAHGLDRLRAALSESSPDETRGPAVPTPTEARRNHT